MMHMIYDFMSVLRKQNTRIITVYNEKSNFNILIINYKTTY